MVRVDVDTTIDRPVEEVFAYLTDIDRQPEWVAPMTESRKTSSGPTGVGTTFQQAVKFMGRSMDLNGEITSYQAPNLYAFQAKNGPMHMEMQFTLQSDGPESTRVTQVASGESAGFFKLADPILARSMKKQFVADLETLKTLLEGGVATEASSS
jgi:uncharacterized protein YndB with AHSA1/START domain